MTEIVRWAAIRKNTDSGMEWIDSSSINSVPESVKRDVAKTKRIIPRWDKANPVLRIVKVQISEIKE